MTKKQLQFSTRLYGCCAMVWIINFFLNWHLDGMINVSTVLYGLAGICFAVSAVLNAIRVHRM